MYKKVLLLVCSILFISCNDGDVFVTELDFPQTLEHCTGSSDLIIYTIKESPFESLSAKLPLADEGNFTTEGVFSTSLSSTYTLNHRTYNGNPSTIFCNSLPPTSPSITSNSEAVNGTIHYETILEEDDNDGIPANLEDINNDGDLTNDDTDGDGVPNYLDSDDDGDNVPTVNENPDPNNDGDLSDALDTDGDDIPNYLDTDDDGDGTITRYEDTNGDNDPTNDIADTNISTSPDYLNDLESTPTTNDHYRDRTTIQNFTCVITLEDVILTNNATNENLTQDTYLFGSISTTINESHEVPFN